MIRFWILDCPELMNLGTDSFSIGSLVNIRIYNELRTPHLKSPIQNLNHLMKGVQNTEVQDLRITLQTKAEQRLR